MKSTDNAVEESDVLAKLEMELVEATMESVRNIEPFHEFLTEVGGELLLGYEHNVRKNKLSKSAGEKMLRDKLDAIIPAMRKTLYPLQLRGLEKKRVAALTHMALIVGCDRLLENKELWKALAKKDYRGAYTSLMMTQWAPNSEDIVRRRVPALGYTLLTGES